MDNHKVSRECGDGWDSLIDPLVQKCNELEATVYQIKEKFGTLRFYYSPTIDEIEKMVEDAEDKSGKMCEMCGGPGKLMVNSRGSWLKTLCQGCALELGYKAN